MESMLRLARGAPGGHGLFLFEKIAKVLDLEDKQRDPQLSMLLIVILYIQAVVGTGFLLDFLLNSKNLN